MSELDWIHSLVSYIYTFSRRRLCINIKDYLRAMLNKAAVNPYNAASFPLLHQRNCVLCRHKTIGIRTQYVWQSLTLMEDYFHVKGISISLLLNITAFI